EIMSLHAIAALRIITLAPENEAHLRLIVALRDAGFAVQLGHSEASYALAKQAFGCGARGVTHLFNAMSGFHHRSPGLVGASLAHAEFAEIIPDLLHVHPGAMLAAYRAIPGLYAVTDATAATGMPDGSYRLGEQTVQRCLGSVRLPDGSLAGSALTMDQAFRNLVSIGLSLNQASEMLSERPAQMLELTDRGRISKDYRADFVVLDRDNLLVQQVVIGGRVLNLRHSALSQSSP
ncbi:MAG: N-acetylglucosamine-6-phosphate deacetylase, partial [Betaproteobacteria bacterium]|nr:N-acetylglucosamine-6-phosphate deacetylase [Betaproteobacteria bacterium]